MDWYYYIPKSAISPENLLDDLLKGCHCIQNPRKKQKLAYAEMGRTCMGLPVYGSNNEVKFCLRLWSEEMPATINIAKNEYEKLNKIAERLLKDGYEIDFFVKCKYSNHALKLSDGNETIVPGIVMEWAGDTLASVLYPQDSQQKPSQARYKKMADNFLCMCRKMKEIGIVHGDLSAMNITVTPDLRLKLIDYDSLYIPSMNFSGHADDILGTDGFNHPNRKPIRTLKDDNFAQLIIYLTLLSYSFNPSINNKEEPDTVLLFSAVDLMSKEAFKESYGYKIIKSTGNLELLFYLNELEKAFDVPYDQVPFLCDLHYEPKEKPMPQVRETKDIVMAGFCGRCGHHFLNQTDLFCPDCGKKRETL